MHTFCLFITGFFIPTPLAVIGWSVCVCFGLTAITCEKTRTLGNVDDFDAGLAYFETEGYSLFGTAHETDSSITALLTKGDGTYIVLFHHKK